MSALRPLPPRPSLEFEHKEAKALLRRLRAGDPDAFARARERHPAIDSATRIRLADAQLVIARDYGFASWPKLVRYFGDVERQQHALRYMRTESRDFFDGNVRSLLVEHRERRRWTALTLASYVPRFYGMRAEEAFSHPVTDDEARLAIARSYGFPSWSELLDRTEAERRRYNPWGDTSPVQLASDAMRAADVDRLRRVVEEHRELLRPSRDDFTTGRSLAAVALNYERRLGVGAMRPMLQWLEAQGLDVQGELNRQLCGRMGMKTEDVRWLLERGADPNWVAPNGIPVLEHALMRYWRGEAVDVLAERAVPRKALWIAAGLGDVDGVRRSLDARGNPTPAAHKLRPDFDAVGQRGMVLHPDPDDQDILMEVFLVAMLNGRTAVLEYMVSRGFPLNSLRWETPMITMAVGNIMVPVVECLVRCGADLDLRGWRPQMSAREIAREYFEDAPHEAARRRLVELCGMDPDKIFAELEARPRKPAVLSPHVQMALDLASDDAYRLGQSDIRPENLLFGLLRNRMGNAMSFFARQTGMDFERFRADVKDRVRSADDRVQGPRLPMHSDAQAVIDAAIASATARRGGMVHELYFLHALARDEHGAAVGLLRRYGGNATTLNAALESAL